MERKTKWKIFMALGIAAILSGVLLMVIFDRFDITGRITGIPGIIVGMGGGIFGASYATYYKLKDPLKANQIRIEENDERTQMINNMAKAKGFDVAMVAYIVLAVVFAIAGIDFYCLALYLIIGVAVVCSPAIFMHLYNKKL